MASNLPAMSSNLPAIHGECGQSIRGGSKSVWPWCSHGGEGGRVGGFGVRPWLSHIYTIIIYPYIPHICDTHPEKNGGTRNEPRNNQQRLVQSLSSAEEEASRRVGPRPDRRTEGRKAGVDPFVPRIQWVQVRSKYLCLFLRYLKSGPGTYIGDHWSGRPGVDVHQSR